MARTLTSTAYSATPKSIHTGVNSVSFNLTTASGTGNSLSASANATIVLGPKIPNGSTILAVLGSHSSGANTTPVDIGIDTSISKFHSQKAQGTHALATKTTLPFKVSVSDDAVAQYRTVTFGVTPGTDTAVAQIQYTVLFTRDP
jgi:hypothetical protein